MSRITPGIVDQMAAHLAQSRLQQQRDDAAYQQIRKAGPDLLAALLQARKVLAVAVRANWEGATDADVAEHITIKQIDAAIFKATGAKP